MNFFEQELRKLFEDGAVVGNPHFSGRACLGDLGKDLRVRIEFSTTGYTDHYDALKISVLNRTDGPVDSLTLRLAEVLGTKAVPGNPYLSDGVKPHIWVDNGKAEWYAYQPTPADRSTLRLAVGEYLDAFRERQTEQILSFFDKAEAVAAWERDNGVPPEKRMTRWYGDYHLYEPALGVSEEQLLQKYTEISGQACHTKKKGKNTYER